AARRLDQVAHRTENGFRLRVEIRCALAGGDAAREDQVTQLAAGRIGMALAETWQVDVQPTALPNYSDDLELHHRIATAEGVVEDVLAGRQIAINRKRIYV